MSGLKNILIVGGIGWLAYKLFNQVKLVENLTYGIQYIHIDKSKTTLANGLVGQIGLSVYNPSEINVPMKKFIGNLYYNSSSICNLDSNTGSVNILARKNTTIPIQYSIAWSAIGLNAIDIIKSLILGKKTSISRVVSIKGIIRTIAGVEIPVEYDFNLKDYI